MLVGNIDELPESLKRLSTTGLLRDEHSRTVERWIDAASGAGLIRVSNDEYRTLSLTSFGRDVMGGRVNDVQMAVPMVRQAPSSRRASRNRSGVRRSRVDGVARGQRAGRVRPTAGPRSDQPAADSQPFDAVFEALRTWRLDEARRRAVAPFVITHDRTLAAIATSLPRSIAELDAVPGIGPAKLAAYGDAILSLVTSTIATA